MKAESEDKSQHSDQTQRHSEVDAVGYASPPCFMHELDPAYLGYLSREETLVLLNELLEDMRAEAYLTRDIERLDSHRGLSALFRELRTHQARFNVVLIRHIDRLGGTPSEMTGEIGARLPEDRPIEQQLRAFNERQCALYAKLEAVCPRIFEEDLREDLIDILKSREQLIQRCTGIAKD